MKQDFAWMDEIPECNKEWVMPEYILYSCWK
jgi:hypothetical protein